MRIAVVLAICGFGLGSSACMGEVECENESLSLAPSPDGNREAVAFERNCGATTAYSIQVSILNKGGTPEIGDALITNDLSREGYRLEWNGRRELIIHLLERPKVFLQKKQVDDVTISYEPA